MSAVLACACFLSDGLRFAELIPTFLSMKRQNRVLVDNNLSLNTPFLSHFIHPPLSPTLYNRLHIYILPLLPLFPSKKKNSFFDVIFYYEKTSFFFFFFHLVSNTVGTNKEILLKLLNHYLWKQSSITYFLYWIG